MAVFIDKTALLKARSAMRRKLMPLREGSLGESHSSRNALAKSGRRPPRERPSWVSLASSARRTLACSRPSVRANDHLTGRSPK